MPSITITNITPGVSSLGKHTITVSFTYTDLTDLGLRWRVEAGEYTDFTAGASPATLVVEGLQSDGVAKIFEIDHEGDGVADVEYWTAPNNDLSAGIRIYFDADSDSDNYGKIVVGITNAELVPMNYYIGVRNSLGSIKDLNLASADLTSVPVTATGYAVLGDIDKSKGGAYLEENYIFDIRSQFGAATPVIMPVQTYPFTPLLAAVGCSSVLELNQTINCEDGIISFTDATDYTGYVISSQEMRVIYPNIKDIATPADVVTIGSTVVSASITYINATYAGTVNNLIKGLWTDANGVEFEYLERFERRKEVFVDCQTDLCAVSQCITDEFARIEAAACEVGGYNKLSGIDKDKFMSLSSQLSLFAAAKACNDIEKLDTIIRTIKDQLPSSCGCGDSTDNAPVLFNATNNYASLFSGSNLGGGARPFSAIDGTVFEFRTIKSTTTTDLTVVENGNVIEIANTQVVCFSMIEFDHNSAVANTDSEVFVVIPSVWNGKTIKGMVAKPASGAGSIDVKVMIDDVVQATAECLAVTSAGREETFATPVPLSTGGVIRLKLENLSSTLTGMSVTLWI